MESIPEEAPNSPASEKSPIAISYTHILWCSLGLTILAGLVLPIQLGKKYKADISITATGVRDENVKWGEVWVGEFSGPGIVAAANAPGWERREHLQVSYQFQPATLKWSGAIDPEYRLYFIRHPNSGRMRLTINGQTKEFILYSDKVEPELVIRPYELMTDPQPVYGDGLLKAILSLVGLFILIHITLLFLIRRTDALTSPTRFPPKFLWFLAAPSLIMYTVTLLAMWPGQMSSDSVSQWVETETGHFGDAHLAMLTIMMWLVTRIWHSPTVIPVIQILALTGVTVLVIAKFREFGLSKFFCYLIAIAFPFFPANFLMVTTIWKDVPYTIALLFAFWLLLSLTLSQGTAARSRLWRICFIAAMTIVLFTRHNGILVALSLPIICAIVYRRIAGRFFITSAIGLIAAFYVVKSVFFPFLNIIPLPKFYHPMTAVHVLAANVVQGALFTKKEEELLQTVYPLERWKELYNCQTYGPLLFGDSKGTPSYEDLANHSGDFMYLAMKRIWEHPGIYLHHQACATSMLWRIIPFQGEVLHSTPLGVVDFPLSRQYGLTSDSKLPRLQKLMAWFSNWSKHDRRIWFFWRPGFWLLLSLIATTGLALSMRDAHFFMLLAPSILNTLSLAPIMAAPDFRYDWIVVAIGVFLVPLALFRRRSGANAPVVATTNSMWIASERLPLATSIAFKSASAPLQLNEGDRPIIAAVIPCYRVREHILPLLSRIGPECSLIYCVDDKCPENSGAYIQEHTKDPRVRVLFHEVNQGVGGAVMTGYKAAIQEGATVMVKLDGDGQMDPALLPAFVAPIIDGNADYTKGNRFFHVEDVREMPPLRLFGNAVLSFMTKLSSGYWSTFDPTNGYTAIHASVACLLPFAKIERRYFFESDMLFRLNVLRARVVDIPMAAVYRGEKSSLVISSIAGEFLWKHARNFAKRIGYNYFLRDFSIASVELLLGVPLVAFGFFFGLHTWILSFDTGVVSTAGTVMLSVLPSILGVQFLLSFISHDILRTPSEPMQRLLVRLPKIGTTAQSEGRP